VVRCALFVCLATRDPARIRSGVDDSAVVLFCRATARYTSPNVYTRGLFFPWRSVLYAAISSLRDLDVACFAVFVLRLSLRVRIGRTMGTNFVDS
jgi:hypothetical protein